MDSAERAEYSIGVFIKKIATIYEKKTLFLCVHGSTKKGPSDKLRVDMHHMW